jgi:hypothetical protein
LSVSGLSENSHSHHQKFSKLQPSLPSQQKWEPRDISELGANCHSLKNISSTIQKQDTPISFCQSEPNFCNPITFSTSGENGTVETNTNLSRCDLHNLDYYRYRKRMVMGGGDLDVENQADYDFANMISEDCGCSSMRIPGGAEN